jgi:hypothetical protein
MLARWVLYNLWKWKNETCKNYFSNGGGDIKKRMEALI